MKLHVEESGNVSVVAVEGRLDAASAAMFKSEFSRETAGTGRIVLDLKGMDFIDSTGLGCVVACLKSAVEADGNIKISNLQDKPRMVFEITRAYRIFDIYDDTETAVASYQ